MSTFSVEQIARVCHEANRAVQAIQADPAIPVNPPWDDLSEELQQSVISGVAGVMEGNTPEQSHDSWVKFKERHGWRLGTIRDDALKVHPLLVPYADLPQDQKVKDELFVAIVGALA